MESFNLEQLNAFIKVFEQGSFAKVAQKESKHASTISRRVNNLELDLGLELFTREASQLLPTEHGRSLYNYAKALVAEAELFQLKASSCFEGKLTKATIAIDNSVQEFGIISIVATLISENPSLDLSIVTGNTLQIQELLNNNKADLAIALSTFRPPNNIVNNKLFNFDIVRVMSSGYGEKYGIEHGDVIDPSLVRSMRQIVLEPLRKLGVESQVYSQHVVNADSLSFTKRLLEAGAGWGNMPKMMCNDMLENGQLIEFSVAQEHPLSWSVDVLWQSEKPLNILLSDFVDKLYSASKE